MTSMPPVDYSSPSSTHSNGSTRSVGHVEHTDLSKRTYLIVVAVAAGALALAALHGIADVWLWGHNGFNGAAFFNAARNSLRFGVVGQALYHLETWPPSPSALYTHHPLLLHFHLIAALKIFGAYEWAGRAVPAFYSVADLLALAWVTQRWWNRRLSAIACVIYALTPLNLIFANMIDHEQGSIAFLLLGLDGAVAWLTHQRRRDVVRACLGFAIAAQWDWPAYPMGFLVFCVVAWRGRSRVRNELRYLAPFALTMLVSFVGFFGWIWRARGSLADMRASMALRTSAVDGYAWRIWERGLDLYGPILIALFATGLMLVVKRREPRHLIVVAFVATQVFHSVVFRQAGFIHAYWTWHVNPALAIAAAEALLAAFVWAQAHSWQRYAIAVGVVLLSLQAIFAARQFQWGYATGAASYAYSSSDTDQRDENIWAREVGRAFPRDGTRYQLSASIHRRRSEFDIELDAPSVPGDGYARPVRPRLAHDVALVDLHHLTADARTLASLRKAMDEHAAQVWDERFIAIDLAAAASPLRHWRRDEEPTSVVWSWLHQPGAQRFHWREVATSSYPFQIPTIAGKLHGGAGGVPFAWTCPASGHLTSLEAAFDGNRLTALRPRCDTGDGPWVGGRFVISPNPPLGWLVGHPRRALPTRDIACPDGAAIYDLRITADRTVREVGVVCEGERLVVGLRGHYGDLLDGMAVEYAP